jgi:hypothetical protein
MTLSSPAVIFGAGKPNLLQNCIDPFLQVTAARSKLHRILSLL